eukprot:scaffold10829_cov71-Phaeocystis_antarctica.AAC.2
MGSSRTAGTFANAELVGKVGRAHVGGLVPRDSLQPGEGRPKEGQWRHERALSTRVQSPQDVGTEAKIVVLRHPRAYNRRWCSIAKDGDSSLSDLVQVGGQPLMRNHHTLGIARASARELDESEAVIQHAPWRASHDCFAVQSVCLVPR